MSSVTIPAEVSNMAVLISAEVKNQTVQGYEGMLALLSERLATAPGLIVHTGHANENGWRVIEIWHTKAQADQFYAQHVAPLLPAGIRPKRSIASLHSVVTPTPVSAKDT